MTIQTKKLIKPVIGRPGSKSRLAGHISKVLQEFNWNVYVEPFCGSCAVYLRPLRDGIIEKITSKISDQITTPIFILNDMYYEIYNLFKVIREQPNELARLIEFTPYSRYEHYLSQTIDRTSLSDLERAKAYLIDNRMSFGSKEGDCWGFIKTGTNVKRSEKDFNSVSTPP